jgi:hypothetical protein
LNETRQLDRAGESGRPAANEDDVHRHRLGIRRLGNKQ